MSKSASFDFRFGAGVCRAGHMLSAQDAGRVPPQASRDGGEHALAPEPHLLMSTTLRQAYRVMYGCQLQAVHQKNAHELVCVFWLAVLCCLLHGL